MEDGMELQVGKVIVYNAHNVRMGREMRISQKKHIWKESKIFNNHGQIDVLD